MLKFSLSKNLLSFQDNLMMSSLLLYLQALDCF